MSLHIRFVLSVPEISVLIDGEYNGTFRLSPWRIQGNRNLVYFDQDHCSRVLEIVPFAEFSDEELEQVDFFSFGKFASLAGIGRLQSGGAFCRNWIRFPILILNPNPIPVPVLVPFNGPDWPL